MLSAGASSTCALTVNSRVASKPVATTPLQRSPTLSRTSLASSTSTRAPRQPPHRDVSANAKIGFDVYQFQGMVDPEVGTFWASVALATALASFVATFGITPYFSQLLKEPETWREIYPKLIARGTQSFEPVVAASKVKEGGVLLDVSMETSDMRIDGSIRVPLYRPIEGWTIPKTMRRAGFAAFGVEGTERNPFWLQEVEALLPKDTEIIVVDTVGGSLETKIGLEFGTQSRSLKAVYLLQNAGYTNVSHVKGGLRQWARDELPVEVEEKTGGFSLPF